MPSSGILEPGLKRREIEIVNLTTGTSLGSRIRVAENALARAIGLLAHHGLDSGGGLLLDPSSGIHTIGMRFPIGVVALDRDLRVRGLWDNLGPFRFAGLGWKTSCVLELPAGVIEKSGTRINHQLAIRPCAEPETPAVRETTTAPSSCNPQALSRPLAGKGNAILLLASILMAASCYLLTYTALRPFVLRSNSTIDFACYYRSASMVLAGEGARIYDLGAQHAYDDRLRPTIAAREQPLQSRKFIAPPFVLLLYLPFAELSYAHAEVAWYVLNASLLLFLPFVLRPFLGHGRLLAAAIVAPAFFLPVAFTLIEGQNSIVFVFLLALALRNLAQGRMALSGCLLAMAAFKPHLLLPWAVVLLISKNWKALAGFCGGGIALSAASCALAGWRATAGFLAVLFRFSQLAVSAGGDTPSAMPNLRGAAYILLHSRMSQHSLNAVILAASALLLIAVSVGFRRGWQQKLDLSFSLVVVVAVLTGYHGYYHELSLLVLPILLGAGSVVHHRPTPLRGFLLALVLSLFAIPLAAPSFHVAVVGFVAAMLVLTAVLWLEVAMPGDELSQSAMPLARQTQPSRAAS